MVVSEEGGLFTWEGRTPGNVVRWCRSRKGRRTRGRLERTAKVHRAAALVTREVAALRQRQGLRWSCTARLVVANIPGVESLGERANGGGRRESVFRVDVASSGDVGGSWAGTIPRPVVVPQKQAGAEHEAGLMFIGHGLVGSLDDLEGTREGEPMIVGRVGRGDWWPQRWCRVVLVTGTSVWESIRRVDGRLAVNQVSVIAYQSVLAEGRFLGTPVAEFVAVIVASVVHPAISLDVGVKSHKPVETGEVRSDGWRSGVLRG